MQEVGKGLIEPQTAASPRRSACRVRRTWLTILGARQPFVLVVSYFGVTVAGRLEDISISVATAGASCHDSAGQSGHAQLLRRCLAIITTN